MDSSDRLKRLTLTAMLIALCVVGANIKIMGSIAFDSMPAFLGAILLGPWYGAILGVFGHLVSAALAGFPLTLPIHLIIAVIMGICMFVFGWIRKNKDQNGLVRILLSDVAGYAITVPIEAVFLYPIMGKAILALFVPLTIATIANIAICEIVYVAMPDRVTHAAFLG
ncbi:ECF transporter S component [Secundilactobacillus silagei]|uniref:ECF transporter S component n=1 Tax=Secundilactobacillus silagei JCM 19001 TaxID=1302250 RepID=A0A1Z5IF99_9LACO|nr:ECF transporter S component [Secundilactobacillus silagei]TDG72088.1 hypothetical protein C5L25_002472 [Secundilactobacillus silagei JCM 19001]GAX00474.1 hypothetical protein IWT126_00489 [Secundilactobacillus silagei JCM 19001]